MKRKMIVILVLTCMAAGCQSQHAKDKRAALERWNHTRAKMITSMAQQQFDSGQVKKSARTLSEALQINSQHAPVYLLMGQIQLELNQSPQALKSFEQCLQLEPDNAAANYYLGTIHESSGDYDKALSLYQKAIARQPDHIPYLLAVVETLVAQDKMQQGLDILLDNIRQGQHDPSLFILAGNLFSANGQPARAMNMIRRAYNLSPDDPDVIEALALVLLENQLVDQAQKMFHKWKRIKRPEPHSIPVSHDLALGDCYLRLEYFHKARICFEQVSRRDTTNPAIWVRLAQTALGIGDFQRANTYIQKALALEPDYTQANILSAYIAIKQRQYVQAQNILKKIITDNQNCGLAHCLLGQSYEEQDDIQLATNCYARALKIDPQDPLAKQLLLHAKNKSETKKASAIKFDFKF